MASNLIVGYRLRAIEKAEQFMPAISAPSNYKDAGKIEEYVSAKKKEWKEEVGNYPYTSTFDAVIVVDPTHERVGTWQYKDREPGGKKQPICQAVKKWLLKKYPNAWPDTISPVSYVPQVVFLGFNTRLFLKVLGIECSLPPTNDPLPVSMWYGDAAARGHRDIEEACIPAEFRGKIDWRTVFARRGISLKEGWTGHGRDPEEDVRIVAELASQLGFRKA